MILLYMLSFYHWVSTLSICHLSSYTKNDFIKKIYHFNYNWKKVAKKLFYYLCTLIIKFIFKSNHNFLINIIIIQLYCWDFKKQFITFTWKKKTHIWKLVTFFNQLIIIKVRIDRLSFAYLSFLFYLFRIFHIMNFFILLWWFECYLFHLISVLILISLRGMRVIDILAYPLNSIKSILYWKYHEKIFFFSRCWQWI